ncbi:MAG: arylsulfatase [Planctomycetaceae bacterium]
MILTTASGDLLAESRPNVIVIMTDDQGFGDLGCHGNPIVRTPHLDAMAARSARWENFYVSPVCTPTRASLMTGRYNYRTRAVDTYRGRAMMEPEELTVAEMLRSAGYATGIFGKWHLGDCYPQRAIDQGFETALVLRGGGIGQPSDPPGGEGKYTDPVLYRNGAREPQTGYCTDVYFTEGMKWAEQQQQHRQPFFLYLATNAPHAPLNDVPAEKLAYYQQQMIAADRFPKSPGQPMDGEINPDQLARTYAMIENIDDNVGRMFTWLDRQKLTNETMVLFLTDNGPATKGWNAGLRGRKADVFDGGIRSPAFFHWPEEFPAGPRLGRIAAHLDVAPTILEVCGVEDSGKRGQRMDGRSLLPALKSGVADWPERTLFFQAHRGDVPFARHHCAVRSERWKLVHPSGFGKESFEGEARWMLFDMANDPYEQRDLAADKPELVWELSKQYDAWFADVSHTRPDNYAPPRIVVGTEHENPTVLTRQDWRSADWKPNDSGKWLIQTPSDVVFQVTLRFPAVKADGQALLRIGDRTIAAPVKSGSTTAEFSGVAMTAGNQEVSAWTQTGEQRAGAMFVELQR